MDYLCSPGAKDIQGFVLEKPVLGPGGPPQRLGPVWTLCCKCETSSKRSLAPVLGYGLD
jgi:hypothetical protein